MMDTQTREQDVLDILRRQYEARGFSFVKNPSVSALPDFLKAFAPDAIATGPDQNIVIEVKSSRRLRDQGRLAQMAHLLEKRGGWHFKIFYADDLSAADDTVPVAEKAAIEQEIAEVRSLLRGNSVRAAFVLAWALLEAAARNSGLGTAQQAPRTATSIAELLGREGVISADETPKLWELASTRNAIVHGDLGREVRKSDVELLAAIVERLISA
jgi:REase_AHJR-like